MLISPIIGTFMLLADSRTDVKIENNINSQSSNVSINTHSSGGNSSVIINNSNFEIQGKIDSMSDSGFSVDTQAISIDSSLASSYKSKSILSLNNEVKVKGSIKNSVLYAEEITLLKDNQAGTVNEPTLSPLKKLATLAPLSPPASPSVVREVKGAETVNLPKIRMNNLFAGFLSGFFKLLQNIF